MDDRVKSMLKIIEEDADSFSKKAEMYFRKRPELIHFVEETYRAYRALAERYDHVSGELHKANHTIASAFPDQLQFEMEDEDDDHLPKAITAVNLSGLNRLSIDDSQHVLTSNIKEQTSFDVPILPTMVDREKAPGEIDRVQKEILVLQTEKEFIRSSYENAIARYQEIETRISSLQEELFLLQDAFPDCVVIKDDEARILMASAALRSCEDTLLGLQEKQKRSKELARMGSRRIMMAKEKLKSFKADQGVNQVIYEESDGVNLEADMITEVLDPHEKHVEFGPDMSVVELAEKINELVNKVISLELTTSSQSAQIESLRKETDVLNQHVESFENEKLDLLVGLNSSSDGLKQTEEALLNVQNNQKLDSVANAAALRSSNDFRLVQTLKPEEADVVFTSPEEATAVLNKEPRRSSEMLTKRVVDTKNGSVSDEIMEIQGKVEVTNQLSRELGTRLLAQDNSMDNENIFLTEYASILENYRQIQKRLFNVEKKNQDYILATNAQLLELKKVNDMKDEEIQSMKQILEKLKIKPVQNELQFSNEVNNSNPRDPELSETITAEVAVKIDDVSEATITLQPTNTLKATSPMVEKFRKEIDTLLDENLEFWLRFSTFFQQIQKFHVEFDDLQGAFNRLNDKKTEGGGDLVASYSLPVVKQLRELKTELQVWLEQSDLLKGELMCRFSSLGYIQEEIAGALADNLVSDSIQLSTYQAAKFQGEVSNMQRENNKVADELQAGIDTVRRLRADVEKILSEFHEKFEPSASHANQHHNRPFKHFPSKIPLRNFLFGVKPKKKPSIFQCVNPAYQKQYSDLSSFPS
ncbi:hypothetical protein HPP92_020803 [Vanilla planifolia]|uniref:NAB domain-containing protein n=1 Tax=Vanilla planifolia TaxID=51239 RepID=A0A835Q6P7_VANPL|nr:hypothetical protein HPP92_020803 [Vanilla planifolia]